MEKIDIAVIPLDQSKMIEKFKIGCFCNESFLPSYIPIYFGEDLTVMGYPLGLYDEFNNLPIMRRASIASVFSVPFNGQPCFLIDARLHSGTSGSPVLTRSSTPKFFGGSWNLPVPPKENNKRKKGKRKTLEASTPWPFLLGIMSSSFSDRDVRIDDVVGLSRVFYATLIPEIIEANESSINPGNPNLEDSLGII
jgi:hypothetical protein